MPNEWHGPDRSICAVSHGRLFWVVGSQVVCIAGPGVPKAATGGTEPPATKKSELPWCVAGGNVASRGARRFDRSVEKITLTPNDLRLLIEPPARAPTIQSDSTLAKALRGRLNRQVLELIDDGPWAAFVVQLGISGEQRHFWRTADTMQTLSLALPHLGPAVRHKAVAFLDALWDEGVPLRRSIHEGGKRREPFDLGPGMKSFADQTIRYEARVEDLYAVWAYAHYAGRWNRVEHQIVRILGIFRQFEQEDVRFDHDGTRDEAEHLNRQLAGVLAAARLFQHTGSVEEVTLALRVLAHLATERVHHERADAWLIRPTRAVSKGLHGAKVPRYVGLVPETTGLLKQHAGPALERNIRALRIGLPLWYQAYGERMIGGENYISPPDLARGIFAALADGCPTSPDGLAGKLDQPWCKADLYYIEKISSILRRLDGAACAPADAGNF